MTYNSHRSPSTALQQVCTPRQMQTSPPPLPLLSSAPSALPVHIYAAAARPALQMNSSRRLRFRYRYIGIPGGLFQSRVGAGGSPRMRARRGQTTNSQGKDLIPVIEVKLIPNTELPEKASLLGQYSSIHNLQSNRARMKVMAMTFR